MKTEKIAETPWQVRVSRQHMALIDAAQKFVWKCETGRARSNESYKEFKEALALGESTAERIGR